MKETQRHLDAFEVWFNQGEPLSYSELVRRLSESGVKVSRTSVTTWGRAFGWKARADKRLAEMKAKVDAESVDDLTRQKKEMIGVVDLALVRLQQALVGGPVVCPKCLVPAVCPECGKNVPVAKISLSVRDIEKLVNAKLKLIGEPERVDLTSGGATLLDIVNMTLDR